MKTGTVLEIIGSDPGSKKDLPEFGNKQGNQFLGMIDDPAAYTRFFIKRG